MKLPEELENKLNELKANQKELIRKIKPNDVERKYTGQIDQLYKKEYGFKESYESWQSIDVDGKPIPWITYPAIYYLDQLDLTDASIFEWGSGNSSRYFANCAKHVTSIESDSNWYNYVLEQKATNNRVCLRDADNYAKCINDESKCFDVISIDGDIFRRLECAVYAIGKLEHGGIIILDNSDWLDGTCSFLQMQGFTQIDFAGPGPINNYMWCTSVFFRGSIGLKSRRNKRPSFLHTGMKNKRDVNINNHFTKPTNISIEEKALAFGKNYEKLKREVLPLHTDVFSSQEGEDILIRRLLKWHYNKLGFYVDVGAHDPVRFSNTYHFYLKGWQGINIDPRPGIMKHFNKIRGRDVNLELGIASEQGELQYIEFKEPAFNTFCKDSVAYAKTRTELVGTTSVKVETLSYILENYLPENTEITFFNIDVEGLEVDVLASSNWQKYRPKIVCAEALDNIQLKKITDFMASVNYIKVASTKNSYFYCEDSFWEEVQ